MPPQEAWLRGPLEGVPPHLMPAAHALVQALEDVERVAAPLTAAELWQRPGGAAAIGFHLRHMAGVLDRLFTYARGEALSETQLAALRAEGVPGSPPAEAAALLTDLRQAGERALAQLRSTRFEELLEPRAVGRQRLASNVLGLLFHAAEHAQRHAGQAIATARIIGDPAAADVAPAEGAASGDLAARFPPGTTALILTDIQPDFLPGGALAVAHGDELLEPVRRLLGRASFGVCVATQDWHPPGHISFASSHPGRQPLDVIPLYGREQVLWPDHCVQGTPGAALHDAIPWQRVSAIVRKGADPQVDSYSGFRNNWDAAGQRPATGLAGYLRERGVSAVVLCGLARDYCVKWSAEDAVAAGFRTAVLWDLTRPVDPGSDAAVRRDLEQAGVEILDSADFA